jgi:hypothetical protein
VLDVISPRVSVGATEVAVGVDHSLVGLLVSEGVALDGSCLLWYGRGEVKDYLGRPKPGGRRIPLARPARPSDIRIHRGRMPTLSVTWSRVHRADLRHAHRSGGMSSVADLCRPPLRSESNS